MWWSFCSNLSLLPSFSPSLRLIPSPPISLALSPLAHLRGHLPLPLPLPLLFLQVSCLIGQYKLNDTEELLDLIIPACKEKGGKLYLKAIQSRAFCLFKQYRYARLLSSSSSLQTCASSWGDLSISRPEPFRAQVQRGARHLPRAGVPGRAKRRAVSSAMLLGYLATPLVCAARY